MTSNSEVFKFSDRLLTSLTWGLLIAVACGLRLFLLRDVSAWYDEAATWKTLSFSWTGMWLSLSQNVHPPFYYLLTRMWGSLFGFSVESLRWFSILCGLVTLPLIETLVCEVRERSGFRRPSLATWLYAISPLAIEQSQQIRMYSLAICLAAGLGIGLVRIWRNPDRWNGWIWLIACGNLLPMTHYYGLWSAATAGLILLGLSLAAPRVRFINAWKPWTCAILTTMVLWYSWLPVLLAQHRRVEADYWIQAFSRAEIRIYLAEWISTPQVRDWNRSLQAVLCSLVVLSLLAALVTRSRGRWILWALAVMPLGFRLLYSLATRNLLQGRYWVMAHLFFMISLSLFLEDLPHGRLRRFLMVPFILWLTACTCVGLLHRYDLARDSGLRQCSEELRQLRRPGELVYVASSYYTPSLQWYLNDTTQVVILQPIEDLKHHEAKAIFSAEEVRRLNEQALAGTDRFWFVADELMSQTVQNPGAIAMPAGWRIVSQRRYVEANRLPTQLELWEVVNTQEPPHPDGRRN